jgi:hypothetical protein
MVRRSSEAAGVLLDKTQPGEYGSSGLKAVGLTRHREKLRGRYRKDFSSLDTNLSTGKH